MLVATGAIIYYLYPTTVPLSFREFEVNSLSTRYLAFLQTMDNDRNAFPSMHCAVATYVGLTVTGMPIIGMWLGYGFIIMITISCLTVKQHVLVDTVAGVALGATVFFINKWLALII
jgi:membrane-associated phospholipid phosphatase